MKDPLYIPRDVDKRERMISLAQVHATLALAAATSILAASSQQDD
jgi:hypothetical protein